MSSLKMTFSLTSLIFLIALGLVFVPTSVMAHTTGNLPTAHPSHTHPVTVAVPDNTNTTGVDETVPIHNAHPVPTITLKAQADVVKGDEIKLAADPDNAFTLVVTFDQAVNPGASDGTGAAIVAADLLTTGHLTFRTVNGAGTTVANSFGAGDNQVALGTVARTGEAGTTFELPITIGADSIPDGMDGTTADANLNKLEFRIQVNVNAAYGLQKDIGVTTVPGGSSAASVLTTFMLVKDFTPDVIVDPDPVMFKVEGMPSLTTPFTATFTSTTMDTAGKLKGATIGIDDIKVTGGYAVEASLNSNSSPAAAPDTVWTVIIQPYPLTEMISVTIADDSTTPAAADATMGVLKLDAPIGTLVSITPETGANDTKAAIVTFTFSAALATGEALMATDIKVTPATAMIGPPRPSLTDAKAWEVLITPTKGMATTIELSDAGKLRFAGTPTAGNIPVVSIPGGTPPVGKQPVIHIPTVYDSSSYIELGSRFQNPMIPAHGWAVLVRDVNGSHIYTPAGATWIRSMSTSLPDLALFFGGRDGINSGTVSLHAPIRNTSGVALANPGADAIVISEIMWGVDNGMTDPTCSQWIEFYNTTTQPIDLRGWEIRFHRSLVDERNWLDTAPPARYLVDIASNAGVTDRYPVHKYHSPWTPKGQSGSSRYVSQTAISPINIVSMYLEINYTQAANARHTAPSGADVEAWSASVYPQSNLPFGIVATPGAATVVRIEYAETPISQELIINEIGNSANDAYDWVEIYNPGDGAVSIKDMRFTTVWDGDNNDANDTYIGQEKILFTFPDRAIPAKSYVVFAASDPKNAGNDLAAGIDITKSDIDQPNKGLGSIEGIGHQVNNTTAFYQIHGTVNLPNDKRKRLYILRRNGAIGSDPAAQVFDADNKPSVVDVMGSLAIRLQNRTPAGWTSALETDRGLTDTSAAHVRRIFNTSMWPLQWSYTEPNKKHPHAKRVNGGDAAKQNLEVGRVYQRHDKKLMNAENHLTTVGYTGVGYDRHALRDDENGGTPGYANNAVKGEKSNWMGQVSISEIMLPTHETEGTSPAVADRIPRATKLPQWIEIYNASLTEGVNLKDWYLEIRNTDSEDLITRDLHGTHRLGDVIIPPNQTVLIVSAAGLNSGNFPEQRLINLFNSSNARQVFSLKYRNDPVLSQVGFYIELRDHKGNVVDQVGNLPATMRRGVEARGAANFVTEWDLPALNHPAGPRTSLIRVYNAGTPNNGLWKVAGTEDESPGIGWRRAVDTSFHNVPGITYYGNQRDFGTPGYRGGGPLPVSLSKFRPERLKNTGEIVVRWITESELNNAGFNILRSDTRDGDFTQVNKQLIAGQGTTSERTVYEWKDTSAKPNVVYYYQIEDVSFDGQVNTLRVSRLKGNVTAAGKATTTWGEIKALQ